jgi:NAD(P)-dependent dehydrogenase (short-subunit alcohol dehydrogenase family)
VVGLSGLLWWRQDHDPDPFLQAPKKVHAMKIAVVTGAAQGLGLVTARIFATAGYRVVLTDLQDITAEAAALRAALQAAGRKVEEAERGEQAGTQPVTRVPSVRRSSRRCGMDRGGLGGRSTSGFRV